MGQAHGEKCWIGESDVRRFYVEEEFVVGPQVPDWLFIASGFSDELQQSVTALDLEDEVITWFEVLRHIAEKIITSMESN